MTIDQRSTMSKRGDPDPGDTDVLSLLLAVLAGALAVVVAVWVLASTNARWALVVAVLVVLAGMLAVKRWRREAPAITASP